mmetsp:Transcript_84150/g.223425  ORF Transcript_84150/g.223425 Transcript_84150/m.223425 type:complete len:362 (-) Transcript_84150:68-1153(-)
MIGFVLRGLGFGLPGEGFCVGIVASLLAVCAICGIHRCMKMRMRDCTCIKKWMRATGTDKFDDFEMMLLVHEVLMQNTKKLTTAVRVTAGGHTVKTDESNKGIFQQPLSIFVEQGTESIDVELLDARGHKVLASVKLDPIQDVLRPKQLLHEKVMPMKQKSKGVLNPRIKLTVMLESADEAEQGLLSGVDIGLGAEANMMLRQQLQKVLLEEELRETNEMEGGTESHGQGGMSDLELLAKGCCGPLEMFGAWGAKETVFIGVRGPPNSKRYYLGVWKNQESFERAFNKGSPEIDLLRVTSVQPDPGRTEVFAVNYLDGHKVKKKLTFRILDRNRDVWVEMFMLLIKMMHDQKEQKKKTRLL